MRARRDGCPRLGRCENFGTGGCSLLDAELAAGDRQQNRVGMPRASDGLIQQVAKTPRELIFGTIPHPTSSLTTSDAKDARVNVETSESASVRIAESERSRPSKLEIHRVRQSSTTISARPSSAASVELNATGSSTVWKFDGRVIRWRAMRARISSSSACPVATTKRRNASYSLARAIAHALLPLRTPPVIRVTPPIK